MRNKKNIILYCLAILLLIGICVIVGRITAKSYIDNTLLDDYLGKENVSIAYCDMGYDPLTNQGYLDNDNIIDLDDLITKDAIIIRAKLNDSFQRELYYECVFSQLQILEVYQGDIEVGKCINIFEPVDCGFKDQMLCTDGYSLMQSGDEYILFLKRLKNTYYDDEKYVYAPTSTRYSKYAINDRIPRLFTYEELEGFSSLQYYSEVKNEEVYLYEKEDYEKYLSLKEQVLEKYNMR